MGGANADRDVAEGADTAVWLALDARDKLTGKFVRDRKASCESRAACGRVQCAPLAASLLLLSRPAITT